MMSCAPCREPALRAGQSSIPPVGMSGLEKIHGAAQCRECLDSVEKLFACIGVRPLIHCVYPMEGRSDDGREAS
jgi:hypothetical protein